MLAMPLAPNALPGRSVEPVLRAAQIAWLGVSLSKARAHARSAAPVNTAITSPRRARSVVPESTGKRQENFESK